MRTSFESFGLGLVIALVLVYLLLMVLFQSALDPLVIMVAVLGAFVGIAWMLAVTGDDAERRVVHGRDHGDRHRGLELDPAGQLRQPVARRGPEPVGERRRRCRRRRRACGRC